MQVLTWCRELGVDPEDERLNPYGGAIACGHPLAATGVRLVAQLAYGLREREGRYGLTALCVGLGWARRSSGRGRLRPTSKLRRSDTASARVAVSRSTTVRTTRGRPSLGRSAIDSGKRALDELESRRVGAPPSSPASRSCSAPGADIDEFPGRPRPDGARGQPRGPRGSSAGIRAAAFPTVAAINGACIGGGVELALHCSAAHDLERPSATSPPPSASSASSPPGRDAARPAPRRGADRRPLHRRRTRCGRTGCCDAAEALELGFADRILEPIEFLDDSIAYAIELSSRVG